MPTGTRPSPFPGYLSAATNCGATGLPTPVTSSHPGAVSSEVSELNPASKRLPLWKLPYHNAVESGPAAAELFG